MFDIYSLKKYNFRIILYALSLSILGVLIIGSATGGDTKVVNRQILGIIVSSVLMFGVSFIRYDKLLRFSVFVYFACIAALLAVIFFGYSPEGAGATRWIKLPAIGTVQPSEFVKIGIIVFFSWFLAKYRDSINNILTLLIFIVSAGLIYVLILIEPDLSTTVVLMVVTVCMLFVAGISYKWIWAGVLTAVPLIGVFFGLLSMGRVPFLKDYQARRILAWINPEKYADTSFQQENSIMAIGSGQLYGKGLNNMTVDSVKHGNFLSQDQTDFIFAVIGEELGFIGSIAVIAVVAVFVFEILNLASKVADVEGKLICVGIAGLIAFQSFTNISVATGIFPNTGLPLPFISYGVSSLMSIYVGLGLVLNVGLLRDGIK